MTATTYKVMIDLLQVDDNGMESETECEQEFDECDSLDKAIKTQSALLGCKVNHEGLKSKFVKIIEVTDPDTGQGVEVEIRKLETGGLIWFRRLVSGRRCWPGVLAI